MFGKELIIIFQTTSRWKIMDNVRWSSRLYCYDEQF